MKQVLILGAGLVSRPIVRYFLDDTDHGVTVASLIVEEARALVDGHPRGVVRALDVSRDDQLEPLIEGCDLLVSLVPYAFHVRVARFALEHRVNMITASYVSPEMQALDAEARRRDVMILNETGLDPGLDHMSAMRMIRSVQQSGGRVTGFRSCCGGLPSPEAADNPWRYKFSWSPRGALLAGRAAAIYLEDGKTVKIDGPDLFAHHWPYDVEQLGRFEIYPNRDSLKYIQLYGLDGIETMFRGTIRYPGWCETMKHVADLGLLAIDERSWPAGTTYAGFTASFLPPGAGTVKARLATRLGLDEGHPVIEKLVWSGLLDDEPLPASNASPLDVLAGRFQQRMAYADGERDMVLLRHELEVSWPDRPAERLVSLLTAYGEPGGDSATSRTVSLPAAIAGRRMLEGQLHLPGVHIPTDVAIAEPTLTELSGLGIRFEEWRTPA